MIKFYIRNNGWAPHMVDGAYKQYTESTTRYFKFPGGELHVVPQGNCYEEVALVQGHTTDDLMALRLWADIRTRMNLVKNIVIPYLPGARQDRGYPLSAKVYADIINGGNFDKVICLDPHSDVMPALLNNLTAIPQEDIFKLNIKLFQGLFDGIVAPDAGSAKKAYEVAKLLNIPLIQAMKHRDMATGKLSHFTCEETYKETDRLLIVDDICDGGGTFKGLSKVLKLKDQKNQLSLYVTHGIFSQGSEDLTDYFEKIYTTDSFEIPIHLDFKGSNLSIISMRHILLEKAFNG